MGFSSHFEVETLFFGPTMIQQKIMCLFCFQMFQQVLCISPVMKLLWDFWYQREVQDPICLLWILFLQVNSISQKNNFFFVKCLRKIKPVHFTSFLDGIRYLIFCYLQVAWPESSIGWLHFRRMSLRVGCNQVFIFTWNWY